MTRLTMKQIPVVAVLLVVALFLAACGASSNSDTSAPSGSTPGSTQSSNKPTVTVPSGPPPTSLLSTDLRAGTGAAAKTGDSVTVQYVGVNYADGKQFDASWDSGQPFTFRLGAGAVIQGWDEGVVGMKVGGQRQLIIPPSLGYRDKAQGPIVPNETLVFVVDLISINS